MDEESQGESSGIIMELQALRSKRLPNSSAEHPDRNMDVDLQITYQSHNLNENLKWSHGHYGHFAPAGLTGTPDRS
jgi:hypothetical protein